MIRWRVYRAGGRMRTVTKLQIIAAVLIGFFLGYVFLPSAVSFNEDTTLTGMPVKDTFNAKPRAAGIRVSADGRDFVVEGKTKRILSGAIHYFRVVPDYWEDRLKKLKAAGLNTVETYVPWNAHEPSPGEFDFTGILDVADFILKAQHLGLHVIVRPGPYICAEWEMGGLPAWLLHDPHMEVRTNYPPYTKAVTRYFTRLFEVLVPHQSCYGGPIIGFQVENEYGYWSNDTTTAKAHLKFLYKLMRDLGAKETMFTSDGQYRITEAVKMKPAKDVIHTLNYQTAHDYPLERLKREVPHHPLMVMEFWTGWFDHWGEAHLERNISPENFAHELRAILSAGASVNLYMFHGGTNFGFMNGGNWGDGEETGKSYRPTVSSYDYDAPLSEWGSPNQKYIELRNVLSEMVPESLSHYPLPPLPPPVHTADYGEVRMTLYIPLLSTLQYVPEPHISETPVPMELLPLNHGHGQGYGYVLYRTFIPTSSSTITIHGLRDYGLVMLDLKPVRKIGDFDKITFNLPESAPQGLPTRQLDILVENGGRVNFGRPLTVRKGITGAVIVDGQTQKQWKIYSFEFRNSFIQNIDTGGMWQRTPAPQDTGPALYKASFTIHDTPQDTFIDMDGWNKGVVFINGANLGRYWMRGPTGTLYVPAPLLNRGLNKVMVFEFSHPKSPPQSVFFRSSPVLDIARAQEFNTNR